MALDPFPIAAEDVANSGNKKPRRKITVQKSKPRYQALSEDMIWIAEQDIARLKRELEQRDGPLTDKERHGFVKVSEQLRKLRCTEAELQKKHDPGNLEAAGLAEELVEELTEGGVSDEAIAIVLRVLGLGDAET